MVTKNPRVQVTLNPDDMEIISMISKKKHMSMSAVIKKVVEDWLEEYEDMLLARRAEEAEKTWFKEGCKTISHEEICQHLGLKYNSNAG